MRLTVTLAVALVMVSFAGTVQAQFNAPIKYNEGPGLKLSDSLVFHPGLAVEGRYDSNVLYADKSAGAPYLRLIGHIDLSTLPPQRLTDGDGKVSKQTIAFRLKTAVSYREYFSDNESVTQQRAVEIDAGLRLTLFPQSMFSFSLSDDFTRTVTARNAAFGPTYNREVTFTRDTNRATAMLSFKPGRLSFDLAYSMNLDLFEDQDMGYANKYFHEIRLSAKWKLLPKTAITLDFIEQIYSYYDRGSIGGAGGKQLWVNGDSYPFRAYAGLIGLITARLSTMIKVGYGNGLYPDGDSYNMLIGMVEVGYQFTPTAKVSVGYSHNFNDSMVSNYYTDEKIYAGYDHLIASRFILGLSVDYRYRVFGGFLETHPLTSLSAHVFTAAATFDYQIKEWVYVGLGYDLATNRKINMTLRNTSSPANSLSPVSYIKHQVYGKVGISY